MRRSDWRLLLGQRPDAGQAHALAAVEDWRELAPAAAQLRDVGWGRQLSYSRKVFVPLTQLCRDVCHYCTFAQSPRRLQAAYLQPEEVLEIARRGADAGCKEVLFTLGDKPELRYRAARQALQTLGFDSTLDYLAHVAGRVLRETGLLPHLNPGLLELKDYQKLRQVAPSMGIMLESSATRLCGRGGAHFGSPDKWPARRLACLQAAAEAGVPMTSGILVGIGETRAERIDALLALREVAAAGHVQEIIIQNFRAKPGTVMSGAAEPTMAELCWSIAAARCIFGPDMSIQAPPNLFAGDIRQLIDAGINDWGGISPVTQDHVNPEAPWPHLDQLRAQTEAAGCSLVERLTVYPRYVHERQRWIDPGLHKAVLRCSDSGGLARVGCWSPGALREADAHEASEMLAACVHTPTSSGSAVARALAGQALSEQQITRMFMARGEDLAQILSAADALRADQVGDRVSYVITRNINYTNVCSYKCGFCAFSKGRAHEDLRGKPYLVDRAEIQRRVREAWDRGATEVCMQGGIHPAFTGQTYLDLCTAAKAAAPEIHVHAFSPLEVAHGARTLGIDVAEFLQALRAAGLGSLPGTAAEILDDEVRAQIAPDKLSASQWLEIVGRAHQLGLPTTSTIMFGHVEHYGHWARHLLRLKQQQIETGGFTEFVPLPFVHMEAPMYLRGRARPGPSLRETVLMHAVARLVLAPHFHNIQVSWTKLGTRWAPYCLGAGVNDLGGTLMNESISRAAGASHGQELEPAAMEALIHAAGRVPWQRSTLYQAADPASRARAQQAPPLVEPINAPVAPGALRVA